MNPQHDPAAMLSAMGALKSQEVSPFTLIANIMDNLASIIADAGEVGDKLFGPMSEPAGNLQASASGMPSLVTRLQSLLDASDTARQRVSSINSRL